MVIFYSNRESFPPLNVLPYTVLDIILIFESRSVCLQICLATVFHFKDSLMVMEMTVYHLRNWRKKLRSDERVFPKENMHIAHVNYQLLQKGKPDVYALIRDIILF